MGNHTQFNPSTGPAAAYTPESLDTSDGTANANGVVLTVRPRPLQIAASGTVLLAATASSASKALVIPTGATGGPFRVRVKLAYDAASTFIAFGTSGVTAAVPAGSAGDAPIEPGETAEFMVPSGTTYIAAISPNAASSANGTVSNVYATTGY